VENRVYDEKEWQQFSKKNNAQGNEPFARQEYRKKSGSNVVTTGIEKSNVENTNMFEALPKSYDDEFPAFPISQNQNDIMVNGVINGTTVEDVCSGKNGMTSRMVENDVKENEILKNDNRVKDTDIRLQVEKKLEFIDKLVDDKRIPNVEESKLWFETANQLLYYKKKWEVKWKKECPI
jgi:hypothetical protein